MIKWIIRVSGYHAAIKSIRNLVDIQGAKGNWDYDNYMTGLFNGLELACAILDKREPQFRNTVPKKEPIIRISDGTDVYLDSYTGGGNDLGFLGGITLRMEQDGVVEHIEYRKVVK